MKKTISLAALAISASTSSFALIGPPAPYEVKTYCLDFYGDATEGMIAGTCDQSQNNVSRGDQIGPNGCTEGQIALTTSRTRRDQDFPIRIRSCLPPNVVQL